MSKLETLVTENGAELRLLNDLMNYIRQTRENKDTPTAQEIIDFFIKPKIQACSDRMEEISKQLNQTL